MISTMTRANEAERTYKDVDHEKEMRDSLRKMPMSKRGKGYSKGFSRQGGRKRTSANTRAGHPIV
jgi:hypothetical protein